MYLESSELGEFVELSEDQGLLRIRCGTIGQPCLVLNVPFAAIGKARTCLQRLCDEWLGKGYLACAPRTAIIEGSVADELNCDGRQAHPLLNAFLGITDGTWLALRGKSRRVALFRNGLRWHGDFDLERIAAFGLYAGVIIDGDVTVDGVFSQLTSTYPGCVLVSGDVLATSFGHGDCHMRVLGDVRVDNIVYGEYNDGSLRIRGSVYGRALINSGHAMHAEGRYQLPVCDWDSDENWSDCLDPELFEWDGDEEDSPGRMVSGEVIREFMRQGRDPFRPGALPVLRVPRPETPTPPTMSEFARALRECVASADVEALTRFLENWPSWDAEWEAAVLSRLAAPSSTPEHRQRLRQLLVR